MAPLVIRTYSIQPSPAHTGMKEYTLVLRRYIDVIDDKCLYRTFRRLEFKSELLLQGREDGRSRVGLRAEAVIGRPFQGEIVVACKTGLVYYGAMHLARQSLCQRRHRKIVGVEFPIITNLHAGTEHTVPCRLLELWSVLSNDH